MIRFLLLIFPLTLQAQPDTRWKLLPDSAVAVPFADLKLIATYRLAEQSINRVAVREILALNSEVANLRTAIAAQSRATDAAKASAELCDTDRTEVASDRDRWQKKAQRRGRTVTILAVVAGVLTLLTIAP